MVAEAEQTPSPRLRGEGWGEGVQASEWRLPLTRPTSLRFAGRPLPASGAR
jgi:hypothetical protein